MRTGFRLSPERVIRGNCWSGSVQYANVRFRGAYYPLSFQHKTVSLRFVRRAS